MDRITNRFSDWLYTLRMVEASISVDILEGLEIPDIKSTLSPTCLSLPDEIIKMWSIFGGTQHPRGTDPAFVEKRSLDGSYIFLSPKESQIFYSEIQKNTELGFEDFVGLRRTCLPVARSVGADILAVDCGTALSTRGSLLVFDPTIGELWKVSNSIEAYFATITKAFEDGAIGVDWKKDLAVKDTERLF